MHSCTLIYTAPALVCVHRYAWCKWTHYRRKRCLTQQELDEAWMGPEFVLDTRYGEHLNVIYLTMVLSGGLPIAYFSAAVWFVVCYWIDKWELVRLSRRPVAYGSDLSTMVMHLLPSAAVSVVWRRHHSHKMVVMRLVDSVAWLTLLCITCWPCHG